MPYNNNFPMTYQPMMPANNPYMQSQQMPQYSAQAQPQYVPPQNPYQQQSRADGAADDEVYQIN